MLSQLSLDLSPTRKMESLPIQIGLPEKVVGSSDEEKENSPSRPRAPPLLAPPSKSNYHSQTGFVHCQITRCGSNRYHLSFQAEDAETVSIIANKIKSSRTTNFHLFDALRGGIDAKLSKKSGHYLGKLRRDKDQPVGCYSLYNSSREKEQVAAYVYDVPALMQQVTDGQPPRKMQAIIPKYSSASSEGKDGKLSRHGKAGIGGTHNNRLMEHLHNGTWRQHKLVAVQTRPPKYQEGQYRLNFSGRVLYPSVKNMQLENEQGDCLLQFGKVDDDTFHLDYKAPFTAFSALGAALCQFDM